MNTLKDVDYEKRNKYWVTVPILGPKALNYWIKKSKFEGLEEDPV